MSKVLATADQSTHPRISPVPSRLCIAIGIYFFGIALWIALMMTNGGDSTAISLAITVALTPAGWCMFPMGFNTFIANLGFIPRASDWLDLVAYGGLFALIGGIVCANNRWLRWSLYMLLLLFVICCAQGCASWTATTSPGLLP